MKVRLKYAGVHRTEMREAMMLSSLGNKFYTKMEMIQ